jgi:hypothetical protein
VKLAASQVLQVPLPPDDQAWDEAAALLESGAPVADVGATMNAAYRGSPDLLAWWSQRV